MLTVSLGTDTGRNVESPTSNNFSTISNKLNQQVSEAVKNHLPMKTTSISNANFLQRQTPYNLLRKVASPADRFGGPMTPVSGLKWMKMEVPPNIPKSDSPQKFAQVRPPADIRHKDPRSNGKFAPGTPFGLRAKSPVAPAENTLAKYRSLKELLKSPSPNSHQMRTPCPTSKPVIETRVPNPPQKPEPKLLAKVRVNETAQGYQHRQPQSRCSDRLVSQIPNQQLKETVSTMSVEGGRAGHQRNPSNVALDINIPPPPPSIHDFEILKQIGRGRFSKVFMIRHKATGFLAALKLLNKKEIAAEKLTQQIQREIQIHSSVQHPHIIQFYAHYEDHVNVYIIFELACDGQLFEKLNKLGHFSQETTSVVIRNVLEAVAHLHHKHILHRDIKPENVVVVHGVAKLCDLGWSVNNNAGKLRQTFCGTPLYASPQLITGDKYNQKNDLWAIGVLAYELFYGRIPFDINRGEQLRKIVTEDVVFPEHMPASGSFKDFITTLLSKNPFKRLDCDEMLRHPFITKFKSVEVSTELI